MKVQYKISGFENFSFYNLFFIPLQKIRKPLDKHLLSFNSCFHSSLKKFVWVFLTYHIFIKLWLKFQMSMLYLCCMSRSFFQLLFKPNQWRIQKFLKGPTDCLKRGGLQSCISDSIYQVLHKLCNFSDKRRGLRPPPSLNLS